VKGEASILRFGGTAAVRSASLTMHLQSFDARASLITHTLLHKLLKHSTAVNLLQNCCRHFVCFLRPALVRFSRQLPPAPKFDRCDPRMLPHKVPGFARHARNDKQLQCRSRTFESYQAGLLCVFFFEDGPRLARQMSREDCVVVCCRSHHEKQQVPNYYRF
jgi:hypothetical protein